VVVMKLNKVFSTASSLLEREMEGEALSLK
jgi:hypothetical protein